MVLYFTPSGAETTKHKLYMGKDKVENEEAEEQRFSTLEKKIRALEKSKKSVLELQKKMKRGIEMDPQQQAPCF